MDKLLPTAHSKLWSNKSHSNNITLYCILLQRLKALLPVNQSFGVPQQWQHQTECCTPVDYTGNLFGEAAGLKGLTAAQLAMLNLWPGRNLSGPLQLDPS
jgi:hypothetical protein